MRLYLIGGAVLLTFYLLAQYFKPRETDWSATYLKEDKIPFGLYILNKELYSILPRTEVQVSNKPVYNTLKGKGYKNTSYLLVAGTLNLNKLDLEQLLKFVKDGNQVFIAATNPGPVLRKGLGFEIQSRWGLMQKEPAVLNFVNPLLANHKGYVFDRGIGSAYFSKIDNRRATVLGKNDRQDVNFVKYSFGRGAIYLLPDPNLLTNYSLLRADGSAYAAKALSYLPESGRLIWDEHYTRGDSANTSILRVIFQHEYLRWAYFIALVTLLTFVFFEMKRRQRIIPVMEPLKNTTLDFVKVVARLYYQQRDNSDIAKKKILYFFDFLRTNYRINTNLPHTELITALEQKSVGDKETLQSLFASIAQISQTDHVSDKQLIALNKNMEEFYTQAR